MLADFTVSDMAPSVNDFANVLGQPTWSIAGSSTAKARTAPNGDFHLQLGNLPSLDIAAMPV